MKKIAIITPVPDMVNVVIAQSMLRKATEEKVVEYNVVDLREFGRGNYRQIDDTPFGGGSGMVMMAEPLVNAIESTLEWMNKKNVRIVFLLHRVKHGTIKQLHHSVKMKISFLFAVTIKVLISEWSKNT